MSNMLDAGPEIKSNKWHKLQAILCIIVAIVIIMMVFNSRSSPSYSQWSEEDFANEHFAIIKEVSEYCITGDFDLALNHLEENAGMYKYLEDNEKYTYFVQIYLIVHQSILNTDTTLRNAVKYYINKDKYVVLDINQLDYFIAGTQLWTTPEYANGISAIIVKDFMNYDKEKGILYKYKLKMQ